MKMVKSLLLGSAAGLVAIAGAQAADLPVKAKPVEYVRVCSAYGAGFYYIPGTDICLRVGGYVFIEAGYNGRAGDALIYSYNIGTNGILDRDDNRNSFRTRGDLILDARAQTSIGTVRTYISMGADYNSNLAGASPPGNVTAYLERAFIQFAGFTVGQAATFFDFGAFYSIVALSSIAWGWGPVFAYTAQFGNGFSGTISLEDGQAHRTKIATLAAFTPAGFIGAIYGLNCFAAVASCLAPVANGYGGQQMPDVIGNLRVDQAWGSAQISGALHQLRVNQLLSNLGWSDSWGWAVLGGIEIKTPMVAPGDSIMLQGVYSKGAVEFTGISASPLASAASIGLRGALFGTGPWSDIFDAGINGTGGLDLTTAWSVNLMFRHFWQPNLRSAFWVGWNRVEPGGIWAAVPGVLTFNNPTLEIVQAGGNIIWSPAPTLDLSLDLLWSQVKTGFCNEFGIFTGVVTCNQTADQVTVWTRWRRNF